MQPHFFLLPAAELNYIILANELISWQKLTNVTAHPSDCKAGCNTKPGQEGSSQNAANGKNPTYSGLGAKHQVGDNRGAPSLHKCGDKSPCIWLQTTTTFEGFLHCFKAT